LSGTGGGVGLGADAELDALVKRHVARAEVTSRSAGEAAFRLPKEDSSRCARGPLPHLSRTNLQSL
jgi:hypothetical protein